MGSSDLAPPLVDGPQALRCAVYTRTSRDDELENDFGSIEAQREVGLAYIASQGSLHWRPTDLAYDDSNVSGRTLERPALQRLLCGIEESKIDVVVVYKLDRLTRSLADFSKLMVLFEEHQVALVSVTQHLNSKNAAGRLAINALMSFAQFERELIGERIRDKITATRRQGLWAGNVPPLGYTVQNQQLLVNDGEAQVVRTLFQRFVELRSMTALAKELQDRGVTTKAWLTKTGKARGGRPIDKNYLYKLLNNRMFLGELYYSDTWHPGIHEPIISTDLWNRTHGLLTERRRTRKWKSTAPAGFMLKGLVFGDDGGPYSPWTSSIRNGRRYCYYIPQRNVAMGAGTTSLPRFPAYQLESVVVDQLRAKLRAPATLIDNLPVAIKEHPAYEESAVISVFADLDDAWPLLFTNVRNQIIRKSLHSVTVSGQAFVVHINVAGLAQIALDILKEKAYLDQIAVTTKRPNSRR